MPFIINTNWRELSLIQMVELVESDRQDFSDDDMTNVFDIADAVFWWTADHYDGSGSEIYELFCRVDRVFKPGASQNGPADEASEEIYDALCEMSGRCSCRSPHCNLKSDDPMEDI